MIWWSLSQLLSLFADRRPSRLRKLNDALLASSSSSSSAVFCFVPNLSSQSIVCREQLVSGEMYIYAGCLTKLHGGAYASPCYDSPTIQPGSRYLLEIKKKKKCAGSVIVLCCCCCVLHVCVCSLFFLLLFFLFLLYTHCAVYVCTGAVRHLARTEKDAREKLWWRLVVFLSPQYFYFILFLFKKEENSGRSLQLFWHTSVSVYSWLYHF